MTPPFNTDLMKHMPAALHAPTEAERHALKAQRAKLGRKFARLFKRPTTRKPIFSRKSV